MLISIQFLLVLVKSLEQPAELVFALILEVVSLCQLVFLGKVLTALVDTDLGNGLVL